MGARTRGSHRREVDRQLRDRVWRYCPACGAPLVFGDFLGYCSERCERRARPVLPLGYEPAAGAFPVGAEHGAPRLTDADRAERF